MDVVDEDARRRLVLLVFLQRLRKNARRPRERRKLEEISATEQA
jgi:hypothetical protein